MASDDTTGDLKAQVMVLFRQKAKMMTSRDVARELKLDHRAARQVLTDLINDGQLEFTSFGGATFIKMAQG